jgi:hypothetical protein
MPPQQAYRLLDFIDQLFGFCAHGRLFLPERQWGLLNRRGT